ncbi:hypothetical protein P879_07851 [Paragonimus westermani]|uniref:Uncharacterized protein n=1 Tax=Paragonimus westermani TaxID=34504 RepID=A0A8T0DP18_9TREM|nr:hypothetical protein P879_07851 [Paragonimus westermani]
MSSCFLASVILAYRHCRPPATVQWYFLSFHDDRQPHRMARRCHNTQCCRQNNLAYFYRTLGCIACLPHHCENRPRFTVCGKVAYFGMPPLPHYYTRAFEASPNVGFRLTGSGLVFDFLSLWFSWLFVDGSPFGRVWESVGQGGLLSGADSFRGGLFGLPRSVLRFPDCLLRLCCSCNGVADVATYRRIIQFW